MTYFTIFVNPIQSVYNGSESASYLGPKIWKQIPSEIGNQKSLKGFKREIKKWKPKDCPCRICKSLYQTWGLDKLCR